MRRALLALPFLAFVACATPCEELGNKLCSCFSGTTQDSCEQQVEDRVGAANPDGEQEDWCEAELDACESGARRDGARFCEWIETPAGKEACGLAYDSPQAGP
jgi:hypothetical protein